jgi:hypothetical protein
VKQRDDAQAEVESNETTATAGLFVDTTRTDLHLVPGAAVAIDQGVPLADCGLDWDGQPRPYGPARDIGADEYVPAALPALSIGDAAAVEGNTGSVDATFEVSLSQPSSSTVTVAFAAVPGTATAGNDYLPASGTLTFAPGVTEQAVAVAVLGDTLVEPDETFGVDLSSPVGATVEVGTGTGTIVDDDAAPLAGYEVGHGSHQWADLAQGEAVFKVAQQPRASYEVTVDAASGDTTPLVFERLAADNLTILQTAAPVGTGSAVTLRWRNATALTVTNQHLRLRGACSPSCGPDDVYRLRAWETTLSGPRYNNSGGQVTVLLLANGGTATVEGRAYFWSASGTLLASHPFMLGPRQSFSLNTASLPPLAGQSGSVTVAHTGGHDALIGKTVALEPTTGFSFDTPLVARAVR